MILAIAKAVAPFHQGFGKILPGLVKTSTFSFCQQSQLPMTQKEESDDYWVHFAKVAIKTPLTEESATRLLMNWKFAGNHSGLLHLRERLVIHGKLTSKQLEIVSNIVTKEFVNQALRPFNKFTIMDPILLQLLQLRDESLQTIKQENESNGAILQSLKNQLLENGVLSAKQVQLAGTVLYYSLGKDNFKINGSKIIEYNQEKGQ